MHLTLPPISPLKTTIIGHKMSTLNAAKRSAALKACIELFKLKELNENLLPRKNEDVENETNWLFPHWRKEKIIEGSIPGTHSKKRYHQLVVGLISRK